MIKNSICSAFLALVAIFFLASCGGTDEKYLSEGEIVYDATPVDDSNPMASMAPSKMTFKFREEQSVAEMSAGMGLFSTAFISDPEDESLTQTVKLLNKKFVLKLDKDELTEENKNYPFKFTETDETKIIAGYNCKKVHVTVEDDEPREFDIYYTEDLDVENPNFATPFNPIKGILMEYQVKKFGLEMKFTAKKVNKCEVEDEVFAVSNEYKSISQEEMDEIFLGIQ